jgi:putative DNA primase/helicase
MNRLDFLREYFSKTEGAVYICALRNSDSQLERGEVNRLCTRDLRAIESFVSKQDRKEHQNGIYFAAATLKEGRTGRKAEDCYQFPAIFADIDDKNHSLTREHVLQALERIESPPTMVVDSGHGLQAHWLLSEPSEEPDRIVDARRKIQALTASDAVHDAPRVMRLPGTHNSKEGDWLEAKVVSHHPGRRYSLEALQDWLERQGVIIPRKQSERPQTEPSRSNGHARYYHEDEARISEALHYIPADDRDVWLKVGFALESELGAHGRALWDQWSAKCPHKFNQNDQQYTWKSFKRDGVSIATLFHYAKQYGWQPKTNVTSHQSKKAAAPSKAIGLELMAASDVRMSAIEWVWPNRIAVGKLTLFAGLPDQGKSQLSCDIAARITTTTGDKDWPCREGKAPNGNVIVFSAEDDASDTLNPRLVAAGADLTRIKYVKMVKTETDRRMFDLAADLEQLRAAIELIGNVVLVIFDPLNAYFGHGRIDTFRGSDVRAVLGPMSDLAAELKVAILGLLHFNKKTDVTNVMLRISDSLAFVAAARAVYAVVADDENQRKLLVRGKNNLAPATADKTLAYSCTVADVVIPETGQVIKAPHVLWYPKYVEVTATEAMQAAADDRSPAQIETAMHFLADLLCEGAVEHSEVNEAAEVQRISNATLRRAADKLSIQKSKQKGVKDGKWYWRLPDKGHPWPWEVRRD